MQLQDTTEDDSMGAADARKSDEVFDIERIRELVELMEEHDLREIDLRQSSQRIRLRRGQEVAPAVLSPAPIAAAPSLPSPPAAPPPAEKKSVESDRLVVITSPMVGTFYLRPRPDSEAFVKVGDPIGPDTVVCIIEAMKVFNEIRAEMSGKIVAVLVDNEEPVDFGKPLFKVDPSI